MVTENTGLSEEIDAVMPICKSITFQWSNYRSVELISGLEALLYSVYGTDKPRGILVLERVVKALKEEYK